MARNPMQDIVPRDGKSIRNVPLPESRTRATIRKESPRTEKPDRLVREEVIERIEKKVERKPERSRPMPKIDEEEVEEVVIHREDRSNKKTLEEVRHELESQSFADEIQESGKKSKKFFGVLFAILLVLGLAFLASSVFKGASLTLTPRTVETSVQSDFVAKKIAAAGELSYTVATIKEIGSETVKATGEKQVDIRASGIIIIYNNYSDASQRLIKNTRFATPDGLIYRISDSVTVPGKKGTSPGQVEAKIIADEPGEKYNVGLKDFTIPGFKGDPRYAAFYARSKTPLAGGFSGKQKIVADADRTKARTEIESRVTMSLMKQAEAQVPEGRTTFKTAYKIDFIILPEESVSSSEVTIKEEGVLSIVTFDEKDLSSAVARAHIKDYRGEPIMVTNIDELIFTPKGDFQPASSDSVNFSLAGNSKFEWFYDELALKQALAGQPRSSVPSILQKFPTVDKADISLRPFWTRKFPTSFDKITIKKKV